MPTLSYHTDVDYLALIFRLVGAAEGVINSPYIDTKRANKPSIGIGFNLTDPNVRRVIFDAINLNGTSDAPYRNRIIDIVARYAATPGLGTDALKSDLDQVMGDRARDLAAQDIAVDRTEFFMTTPEMTWAFGQLRQTYEDDVNRWLPGIPDSAERAVLLSLAYNQKSDKKLKLLNTKLHNAIVAGDRAEAWYQIRYVSNGSKDFGTATRR
jgi:hypothetical protein